MLDTSKIKDQLKDIWAKHKKKLDNVSASRLSAMENPLATDQDVQHCEDIIGITAPILADINKVIIGEYEITFLNQKIKQELLKWMSDPQNSNLKLSVETFNILHKIINDNFTGDFVIFDNKGGVSFEIWDITGDDKLYQHYKDASYVYFIRYNGLEEMGNLKLNR